MLITIPFAIWKANDWSSEASSAPSRLGARVAEVAWALESSLESNTETKKDKRAKPVTQFLAVMSELIT